MHRYIHCLFVLAVLAAASPVQAATYWVGNSTACTGSNVHGSLGAALLAAAFNGSESDEIRLTNTVTYAGSDGKVTLTDWSAASAGNLTIAGGYPDCFTSPSGRTGFGNTTGTSITVETSSQAESVVTLRRLDIRSADTGILADSGAEVYLENTRISDHVVRGVLIPGGGYVSIDANSVIEFNGDHIPGGDTWGGGGVYCNGTGSEVTLRGRLNANSGEHGGNAYLSNGCTMYALGGAIIEANGISGPGFAQLGGGVYVDSGGQLFSNGGSGIVLFRQHYAAWGGGLYVNGTGRATLINTRLVGNSGYYGAAIYAIDGGTPSDPQVRMDRGSSCPFAISCSEIEGSRTERSVIHVENSSVRIDRTIIELSTIWTTPDTKSLIYGTDGALIRLGHVGLFRNTTDHAIWNNGAQFEIQHATIARNESYVSDAPNTPASALLSQTSPSANYLHNSIVADSTGVDLQGGSIQSECVLADSDPGDLASGTYYIATPQFIDIAGGDARQTSASPGVDMCQQNPLLWASTLDIEYQTLPANDANNDQGSPGQADGYYDAGFDENHMNVGDDYFTLTAARTGDGTGSVVSVPVGIACGSDCSEEFFNETLVELHANAASGSSFDGWIGCPLPSGNICYISVTEDATVTARFVSGSGENVIFSDRFETAP
ncbi:MAG: hypothetical protein ACOCSR_00125 [Wenzhouxiangella sp.]